MTPPARYERRWTLANAGIETRPIWHVVNDRGPLPLRHAESLEVMPVAAHDAAVEEHLHEVAEYFGRWKGAVARAEQAEAALAAARQVDEALREAALWVVLAWDAQRSQHRTMGDLRVALGLPRDRPDRETAEERLLRAVVNPGAALLAALTPEPEDCRGCGAPAGLPPAGPCADHGTEHARAVPEPEEER
jgi:hypothetical protein